MMNAGIDGQPLWAQSGSTTTAAPPNYAPPSWYQRDGSGTPPPEMTAGGTGGMQELLRQAQSQFGSPRQMSPGGFMRGGEGSYTQPGDRGRFPVGGAQFRGWGNQGPTWGGSDMLPQPVPPGFMGGKPQQGINGLPPGIQPGSWQAHRFRNGRGVGSPQSMNIPGFQSPGQMPPLGTTDPQIMEQLGRMFGGRG